LQANDGSNYITFVYDIKINAWYKFIRQQAGSEDFKTLYFTKYGTSEQLLSNCDDRVTIYNELKDNTYSATRADTETGTTIQISPEIETKKFTFSDSISLVRLRELKFKYTKVVSQSTIITLKTGTNNQFTDSTGSGEKLYENTPESGSVPDKETDYLTINITGAGFEKFNTFRQEFRPIRKGKALSL
jgi:hypothetical protein